MYFWLGAAAKKRRVENDTAVMLERLVEIVSTPIEPLPPDFPFKPAVPEVPILSRYDRPAPPKFWNKFPKWVSGLELI